MQHDEVNNPRHYTSGGIECIEAIEAALTPEEYRGFLKGNILKYTWRERHKGGAQSLEKARWYLNRMLGYDLAPEAHQKAEAPKTLAQVGIDEIYNRIEREALGKGIK